MRRTLTLVVLALAAFAPPAGAAPVPDGAKWTEATIDSTGGVKLHAEVLRPANLPDDAKTPVILSIGPYFNHSGQTGPAGPTQGTSYDPTGPVEGPSDRFYDLVEGAQLMQRGYTYVMVDLRGFGGSTGCLDWGGPGEQADVVNAVKWAAEQPWSTGSVGMYGKSYDAVTGLVGVNLRPPGLKAVVSQEPVYDLYRYLYGDGIRRANSGLTPALYDAIAATPGPLADSPTYNAASLNDPACLGLNFASQTADDDHSSSFWKQRNLIPGAAGSDVPLLLTQGTTENNTVADGLAQYLQNHTGYERMWLGPWPHVRGADKTPAGKLMMGRAGWYDEVMRFYDRFLKGEQPSVAQAQAAVDKARLDLERTIVRAPMSGEIANADRLQVGTQVISGVGALSVVHGDSAWVEANFKEKQLAEMRPGQHATIKIDAYPGMTFDGHVDSIGAGTGSEFSILPAQNANGNWVKVTQRVPVRIAFDGKPSKPMIAGLSAVVKVDLNSGK